MNMLEIQVQVTSEYILLKAFSKDYQRHFIEEFPTLVNVHAYNPKDRNNTLHA